MLIMYKIFSLYGELCATHPWEVIFTIIAFTTCFLTLDKPHTIKPNTLSSSCTTCTEDHFVAADIVVMTIIRCLAILYSYHQFRNLQKLGSKYILGFAGLFVVFSSFVFTSAVLNTLHIELSDLKDALFFFLLMIDMSKAAKLAQYALSASNQSEIKTNISRGVAVLGPTITLDTIVETLVIGMGTLSGVHRLEMLSYFACMSVIVNYVILLSFYPACLALMLDLSKITDNYLQHEDSNVLVDEKDKSNPAAQRVKLIMSIVLTIVHIYSRWTIQTENFNDVNGNKTDTPCTESSSIYGFLLKQFALSADHIVILVLLITLLVKFIYFENKDDFEHNNEFIVDTHKDNRLAKRQERTISSSVEVQTDEDIEKIFESSEPNSTRSLQDCLQLLRTDKAYELSDKEIINLVDTKHIPAYTLEKALKNPARGVKIRRQILQNMLKYKESINYLPYQSYDYSKVMGACCENVIGYVPVPVGIAGPLVLDNKCFYIPMATTEGCLVASTNRGCRAIEKNGVKSRIVADGMTRGPVIRFRSIVTATEALQWSKKEENFLILKNAFDSTSRYARLLKTTTHMAGRYLFIRFVAETGDAMGMNMISKGTEKALSAMKLHFPDMEVLSLSGNVCTDKKPSGINWIEGRGKSVVCEAIIPDHVVSSVLKTTSSAMVDLNISKNLIGSAVAGSIGGFNAHAANIVTAIFIATGQDAAQNVSSSNCLTIMEPWGENGEDLYISCTMPSIEIGTIGGGTILPAQQASLKILGVAGPNETSPGDNAKQLARIVCGTVLAGELSLMAALASGQLVKSHLKYNRSYTSRDNSSLSRDLYGSSCDSTKIT
ncbi:3-hydroxy-3-methylglutaryl-coenzyme A reductase-like [Diorhabda sublineata]|uniref:3-hydroxy-3-methylglutaryl-coenzyme A reductase-like n=1 Tax=Diorhabda sublineata TaxID=1163346 RepID=UPI0024E1162D|nr:3-hydroxy-3-methylglutaryl-coenzyme A reductase-like [Diorhabda sublineata]